MLGKPALQLNAITCHLGNGSSIAAVKNGLSVDTTMGLTPLEG
jgi:acetate kinase